MPNQTYDAELPLQDLDSAREAARQTLKIEEIRAAVAEIEQAKAVSQETMFFEFSI